MTIRSLYFEHLFYYRLLNVRENPTTESKVVGKLLNGNKIDVQ
ncbi:SH3 domain-containing protein, partial [Bacillus sp. D-CC]